MSRRNFFKVGGLSAITSLVLIRPNFGQTSASGGFFGKRLFTDQLMKLRDADFRLQIGSTFNFFAEDVLTQAVLTDVKAFPSPTDTSARSTTGKSSDSKCFSLRFEIASADPLQQATYDVRHDVLGSFQLFLVPGAAPNGQHLLHAVINRK